MRGRGEERGGEREEREGGEVGVTEGSGGKRGRVREITEEMNTTRERKCS